MAVAAIAALVVLVGGGYFGYRMFAGEGSKQTTAAVESQKAEAPPAEAPKDAAAAGEGQPANAGPPAGGAASSTAVPSATPTDTSPLPGQPAVAEDKAAQAKAAAAAKAQAKATTSATPPGAGAPTSATPTPAPSQPGATKAAPKTNVAQAAPQDRWQAYADEMTRCAKEDFFSRVVCQQKVRGRYCEGYWGKVPQCPGNTAVDHGQ